MTAVNISNVDSIVKVPHGGTVQHRHMLDLLERNSLPDEDIRRLGRLVFVDHLCQPNKSPAEIQLTELVQFVQGLKEASIGIKTEDDETQLYEIPTDFFKIIFGKYLKFSCCYFPNKSISLDDAEIAMLDLYCERSQIKDGQSILDLGGGFGSLAIYIAQKYPNCKVTGVYDSLMQKEYVEAQCRDLQLQNVETIFSDIITADIQTASYDRIFAIEVVEYFRNYQQLFKKISYWMKPDGLLFIEHVCHKTYPVIVENIKEEDWVSRYFYNGVTLPSQDLLLYFQEDVSVINHWLVSGNHYAQTSQHWFERMDNNLSSVKSLMESTYGKDSAVKWTAYWRSFLMTTTELFGYNNGEEWMIAHLLFKKK